MEILQYALKDLPQSLEKAAEALQIATWPEAAEMAGDEPPAYAVKREWALCFVAMDKELVGYAEIFPRTIHTSEGALEMWGLASVCVAASRRGEGIGRKVVEACFKAVDGMESPVSLFQTGVPGFYQKLNCKEVNNRFTNGLDLKAPEKNPFWDDHIMIYPSQYNWPAGDIDLNGKGY